MASARRFWSVTVAVLIIVTFLSGIYPPFRLFSTARSSLTDEGTTPAYVKGPFTEISIIPSAYNGDLRYLPQHPYAGFDSSLPPINPEEENKEVEQGEEGINPPTTPQPDSVIQDSFAQGQMPDPLMNFEGLNVIDGGGWYPPDANGDVGGDYYIQVVKIAIGIYNKETGQEIVNMSYNDFFQGPPGSACDNENRGDVVVLYDPQVDRWIVTDFAQPAPNYYECIAVSQSGDPVSGGWYYYAIQANTGNYAEYWNDYPKLGIWADGWYMSANMFTHGENEYGGARLWVLNRDDALQGNPLHMIFFDCNNITNCASLLPANIRGAMPPTGSPEYFANIVVPNSLDI
jgi:hypothetical protein